MATVAKCLPHNPRMFAADQHFHFNVTTQGKPITTDSTA